MQPQLKKLIKDLVSCALNVDILIQSDIAEKSLFTYTIIAIKHIWPVRPSTPTKSLFIWLAQLSPLVSPPTNGFDCIKNEFTC